MLQFENEGKPVKNLFGNVMMTLLLIVGVVIAAGLWRGQNPPGPEPTPPTPVIVEDVVSVVANAEIAQLQMEAQASEEIGRKLDSGEIKTSNQLFQWAKAYQEKIDEQAYAELNKLNQKYLAESDKGYTPEQIALIKEFQALKAEGKRKVAQ